MEKQATRVAYGKTLAALGEEKMFFVLDADLSGSTNTKTFGDKFPERFFDCGIAEGSAVKLGHFVVKGEGRWQFALARVGHCRGKHRQKKQCKNCRDRYSYQYFSVRPKEGFFDFLKVRHEFCFPYYNIT